MLLSKSNRHLINMKIGYTVITMRRNSYLKYAHFFQLLCKYYGSFLVADHMTEFPIYSVDVMDPDVLMDVRYITKHIGVNTMLTLLLEM